MNINFYSFADELEKIAGAGDYLKNAWTVGLHGGDPSTVSKGWRLFNNGMFGLQAAGTAYGALKKEDPTGQGQSRMERLVPGMAGLVGGTIGTGMATMKFAPKGSGFLRTMGAGLGGGLAGSLIATRLASIPWAAAKRRRAEQAQQQAAQAQQVAQAPR